MARIYFPQFNKESELNIGSSIFEYAQRLGVPLNSACGGKSTCHQCTIVVERGNHALNEITDLEAKLKETNKLKEEDRLACQAMIKDPSIDVYVKVKHYGAMQILVEQVKREYHLDPLTKRSGDAVLFDNQIIGKYNGKIYGIAADIGTTTVVLHLLDLENGNCIHTSSFENPQRKIDGDSVIARIAYDKEKPTRLQKRLIAQINSAVNSMQCDKDSIYEFVAVGNSTMRDIFFGLDVQKLGEEPFKSITELENGLTFLNKKAAELSLDIHPDANVYGPPLIGSHVGADTIAVCLATGLFEDNDETAIAIDIGTNTEIVLKHKNRRIATSCAAGSALEPMPGIMGAIEKVSLDDDTINYSTIGSLEPIGICGSGMIDLVAEMVRTGKMDERGYFTNGKVFCVANAISITEQEIKAQDGFIWSKAAISLGIKSLLEEAGIKVSDLDKVYLAGSFGNYIRKESAIRIGLIPSVGLEKVIQIGNAAATGAREILLSRERRELAEKSAKLVEHINLESLPDYGERLMIEEQVFNEIK